jgi:glutaconate CoA-transferase subunit B
VSRFEPDLVSFLVRASRAYSRGGWIFTGFHWPVLAAQVAARVDPGAFGQILEAGATAQGPADDLPTSTTDYAAFGSSLRWIGETAAVFPALARRADRVVLDAANVDLKGRVNSTAIGSYPKPSVRLPGGGGAADAAGAARELVLLHGGADPTRIVERVEHATAAPAPGAVVTLVTRWGTIRLDGGPRWTETAAEPPEHLIALGVRDDGAPSSPPASREELAAAEAILLDASRRGYAVARAAELKQ